MYKSNFLPVFIKAFQFNLNQVYLYIAFHDTNSCKAALQKMYVSILKFLHYNSSVYISGN